MQQADRLFRSRHFKKYDFLLALTERMGGIGLEHHESSENGLRPDYFQDWDKAIRGRELLPHEYTHSWNGKFRRPADLWTPQYNVPMQNSLLWVYEGMTQYWGHVLATRSGLTTPAQARDKLAEVAWDKAAIAAAMKETLAAHTMKMPQLAPAVRVLVCGRAQTPSIDAVLALFERQTVLSRLAKA